MDKLYISGDLVMTKTETKNFIPNGVVCKFNEYIFRDKVFVSTVMLADNFICKKEDIAPIPLTPEILEKNGWNKERYGLVYYKKVSETLYFRLIGKSYGWTLRCGNQNLIEKLEFVHQLQHLLFGIGLNSEMEA